MIVLSGVPTVTGTVLDITKRRLAEQKSAEQLKDLNRWHDDLVGRDDLVIAGKREVNELPTRLGELQRYAIVVEQGLE